jgi:hypothetical protein
MLRPALDHVSPPLAGQGMLKQRGWRGGAPSSATTPQGREQGRASRGKEKQARPATAMGGWMRSEGRVPRAARRGTAARPRAALPPRCRRAALPPRARAPRGDAAEPRRPPGCIMRATTGGCCRNGRGDAEAHQKCSRIAPRERVSLMPCTARAAVPAAAA